MALWDIVERVLKLAGIFAGVAAVAGVYVQLQDIRQKEKQKGIEEWQNAAVYKIIEDHRAPINFRDIFPRYSAAASNFPAEIPRITLDEPHLRLALIRLIQSQAVIEVGPEQYSARNYIDPQELNARTFAMLQKATRNENFAQASHAQLAMQVLGQSKEPLSTDQLIQRIAAIGGNKDYLRDSLPVVLQQMTAQGLVRIWSDGRISLTEAAGLRTEQVLPEPRVKAILPNVDAELLRYILTTNAGGSWSTCYYGKDPDELKEGSFLRRLASLNLISLSQFNGGKDDHGKPCAVTAQVTLTDLFTITQGYYYQYLLVLFK